MFYLFLFLDALLKLGHVPPELAEALVLFETALPLAGEIFELLVLPLQLVGSLFDYGWLDRKVAALIRSFRIAELLSLSDGVVHSVSNNVNVRFKEIMFLEKVLHVHEMDTQVIGKKSSLQ